MTALRSALQGQFRRPASDPDLRRVLRAVTAEARAKDLQVEKLLILLKSVWQALPEVEGRAASTRQDTLDRIITICVEEYYSA